MSQENHRICSHSNRQKLQSSTTPLSVEASTKRNLASISMHLIFPEIRVTGLHYCRR